MKAVIELLNDLAGRGVKLSAEAGELNCYAPKGMLTKEIRDGLVRYKSEIVALLQAREKQSPARGNGHTHSGHGKDKCLHELFVEQAELHAEETAVLCEDRRLTYRQLFEQSRDLALYLQSMGAGPEVLIGLCMERSPDMLVALLAILQSGAAYVPLDPAYPEERLAYMLRDSRAAMVLTQDKLRDKLSALLPEETKLITLDAQRTEIGDQVAGLKAKNIGLRQQVGPSHLAYVIYTSGSTGQPKGVAIEHHSPVTLVRWAREVYSREEMAGVLASTSICFDLSVYEIFATLAHGGTIILAPNALGLISLKHKESVTLINTVPSAMEELVRLGAIPASVQTINLAGEPLSPALVDKIYDSSAVKKVYDLYGPSEDTTYSTFMLRGRQAPQSIGRPIAGTQIYILDQDNHQQPIGVPGELHIAGDGLARGYLHRPELTQEKFVANPFQPGTRMYKTGDLARLLEDGTLQYLGRMDTQVKIRGFRIELGEIEARLNQHPGIQESVVVAQGEDAGRRLIAFYRAKETTAEEIVQLPLEELRDHLMKTQPEYMMPAAVVSLAAIPLSPNGKIDRRALALMEVTIASTQEYSEPRTDTERFLAEVWAEVLNREPGKIGVNDNFFELGGHSLLATQVIARVRSRMEIELPLKAFFERRSIARLAELIGQSAKSDIAPIRPVDRTRLERLPLSFAQERLWFINQLEPGSMAYNLPVAVTIRGDLDVRRLEKAFHLIIARHENLRTVFPSHEGQAWQKVLGSAEFKLERLDLSHYPEKEERDREAREICHTDAATPFDLARGPLLRGKVIRLDEQEHLLLLNMHHIVSDGWSLGILIRELGVNMEALREGRNPERAPLPIQYVDYSVWQRKLLEEGGTLKQHLDYWQQKLVGAPESVDLATDFPRPGVQSFSGAICRFSLDAELTKQLKALARQQDSTLYMVLLAAFKVLLHRYTGQDDICVGSPIANRQYAETEELIGMFANTLALRSQVGSENTFCDLLAQIRATCLEAYEHQNAPFEKVVDALRLQRNLAMTPLFQIMVILQNADMGGLDPFFAPWPLESGISKFDLTVSFEETPEGLAGSFEYSTALYKRGTIARMAGHFIALCRAATATPAAKIHELDYLSAAEKRRLLTDYNDTQAEYPKDKCLHELFIEQVELHAEETAVLCEDQRLTYRQLYDKSRDLALYLQSLGIEPDSLVGLCMEKSPEMVVGLLGILQAGGGYVPLDPAYPDDRVAYMLQDSRAVIVLTQEKLRDKLSALLPAETRLIALDRQWTGILDQVAALKSNNVGLRYEVTPNHLAYVIYTSGSTGRPKGVAIEHRSPVTLVRWAREVYSREEMAGVLASTSICFDLSVYEIFATLACGGTMILSPNALGLINLKHRESVTLINTAPSAIEELVRLGAIPASVQTINLAGEPLSSALVDKVYGHSAVKKVYDLYGPSEDTTYSTYMLRGRKAPQSIGRPIANTQVYILDQRNHPQPIGVPGELHIAGEGLARGYLYRPELTEEKFVANPFTPGTRMYKTGDLARWLEDGTLQYLGRIDTQVKIRGFRIELGEIEARLNQHPGIQDSVVIAQGQDAGRRLIAFYRAKDTTAQRIAQIPYEELRDHLMKTLPEYMAPAAMVSLTAIPLNPNGKVDRRALARMDVTIVSGREYVAPRTETERQLTDIWAQVLNREPEKIGVNDNFFELGGHSLLATQVIAKVRSRMQIDLPLKALFKNSSVALLAELIGESAKSDIPPIRPVDRSQLERLPLSFAQERIWFFDQLESGSAAYNIPATVPIQGELDVRHLEQAFSLIIARHENLRTVFPSHEGRARQQVIDSVGFKLDCTDLSHCENREERGRQAREICHADAEMPFDLARGPLLRGRLIRLAEREHILLLNMHHIVSDGWSLLVLTKELSIIMDALRQGRNPELAPLPIQYVDYSVWQRKWLEEGGALKQHLAYWQTKLTGAPESLDLATDYPRPSAQSFAGADFEFTVDAELAEQLRTLARKQGATLYMVLLAAFKILLHRYSGQNDICVGSPIANRQYAETEGLIGMFVNTLALRSRVEGEDTFAGLLSQVKATCLESYEHQDAPFEKIVETLRLQRNLAISPLFQVMFILQNKTLGSLDQRFPYYPLENGVSKFDLTLSLEEIPEGLRGSVEFCTALYKPGTIERMAGHFTALCRAVVATPAAKIRDLDYISESEKGRLLAESDDTLSGSHDDRCLHELFLEQAELRAEETAVLCEDRRLTYRQLFEQSRDLALYLQSLGVEPDCLVGLCMERSPEMLVAMLGILQAGGAYVPLDSDNPEERLAYMLRDSRAALVLTQDKLRDKLNTLLPEETKLITVDGQRTEIGDHVAGLKAKNIGLRQQVGPNHLAYVIYTSGSTGQPKGVAIEHHSPVTLVRWAREVYSREEMAGVLASTSICFDLSVYEIFATLAHGGTIIFAPNALGLIGLKHKESVTLINTVPSAMEELVRLGAIPASVQTINLAGEPLSPALVDKIYGSSAVKKVYDLYGPSEDTTYSTFMLRGRQAPQSIGRPIAGTQIYILDQDNHQQPIGVPGELHIAGDGLARGYLYRPELTQEKFVANPFQPGTRMYKTGDLARLLEDGTLQYLGRMDTQVKIRGFRIELGEIEARLNQHPGIQESVVVAQGEDAGRRLIAFYRAKETTAEEIVQLPPEELRDHLMKTLPEYMMPAAIVSLAAIPLNPNGKVDRRALTRMDVTLASGRDYAAPRTDTERKLTDIWAEVLNHEPEKIGVNDNFFELGGHSLLATQLIAKIRSRMEIDLPLKALFERSSVAKLAELIDRSQRSSVPAIRPVDRSQVAHLPLSFAQERLWFINQLEPDSAAYNLPVAVSIRGELDVRRLEQAFNRTIARHENLRTVFPSHEGQARQVVLDSVEFKLERADLSHCESQEDRDRQAGEICQADAAMPFDLARGPLLRGRVITLSAHEHILLLNMHHIISDGWSLGILIRELGAIMEGRSPEPAPLPIQYVDYSVWQRKWLEESGALKPHLDYWRQKLADVPESSDLATDHPRPVVQSFAGATREFTLDAELTEQLRSLARQKGVTLYMVLLAAFKVLLYRYTGQNDLCVGTPIANRQYAETEGLIGMFVNTLALRSRIAGEDTFSEFLSQVRATCLEAYEHQDAPFEKVVEILRLQRNLATTPLFQVMLILQNGDLGGPDRFFSPYPLENGISKFDLTIAFEETPEGLTGAVRYATVLFETETIARMAGHFTAVCRAIAAAPAATIHQLEYISEDEKRRLLTDYNDTRIAYQNDQCLHDLFVEKAGLRAGQLAVVCEDAKLTYRQLSEKSRDLALYLQSMGIGPDSLVGLCMERSLDTVVGLLGILQAGGAYAPLDPDNPDERLAYMLRDSRAAIVLTQEKLRDKLSALLPAETRLLALDRQWDEIAGQVAGLRAKDVSLRQEVRPHHLAYVIYTSGSTGRGKGVMVEHRHILSYATAIQNKLKIPAGSSFALVSTFAADLGNTMLFPALLGGGTLHILSKEAVTDDQCFAAYCEKNRIDCMKVTPSHLQALVAERADSRLVPSRTLVFGGEALSRDVVELVRGINPDCRIYNHYGPTECSVGVLCGEVKIDAPGHSVPLGTPLGGTRIYILDSQRKLVPIGIAGELYIGGPQVARGYLNQPELTAERFVADPFNPEPEARMYKTGDVGRRLSDGTIEFLGRNDFQVKIRGFRVEPEEIEVRLREHEQVREAVVIARHDGGAEKRLVAYYTSREKKNEDRQNVAADDLRTYLAARLPDYMVPAAYVWLETLPLTANGKLDRKALPAPEPDLYALRGHEAPVGETEIALAAIWAEVLRLEKVGRHDDFFELGGHSLLATRLMARIRSRLNIDLPLKALFERTSVARLAELIGRSKKSDVPPIRPVDRTQLEHLPLSFSQERLWFFDQLEAGSAAYNVPGAFTIQGELDVLQLERAFNLIIARHENLRTVFPSHEGQARQEILGGVNFRLERTDLGLYADREERDRQAREICRTDAAAPFDLARGPLLRGRVVRLSEHEHILLLNMHHIISDGWSRGILVRELGVIMRAFHEGKSPELAPLPIQYVDYSVWQRKWLEEGGVLRRQLAYWDEKLAGAPESLDLATDYPRPGVQSFAGATFDFTLDAELTEQLRGLARQQGVTLYMVLLAAFKVLLYRYTGQNDICVGTPIANRQYAETEGLIGMFLNTLALRSRIEGETTLSAFLSQVRTTCLEAYEHQDAPFEKVVETLRLQRNLAISPLFQVLLILQNTTLSSQEQVYPSYPIESGVSKFDLTAAFQEIPEGLAAAIEYSTALFEPRTIVRMAGHFTALCRAMIAAPEAKIGDLDFISEDEKRRELAENNDTQAGYPREKCVHELFAEQVGPRSGETAVVCEDRQLTYQQLYDESRDLALYLQSLGVGPDCLVGLSMERSPEMLVGLLGILQAGGAYIPLDPDNPDERLAYMLHDSRAPIVLTQEKLRDKLSALLPAETKLIAVDRQWGEIADLVARLKAGHVGLQQQVKPHHLAYVIYTSGSTGRPKGVEVTHRSVVNLLHSMSLEPGITQHDTLLAVTTLSFDIAALELYLPLCAGARLVVASRETASDGTRLLAKLRNCGATILQATPVTWRLLLEAGWSGDPKLTMLCGGEALPRDLAHQLIKTGCPLWNMYGPTETTIWSSTSLVGPGDGPVTLGFPIANTQIYILDPNNHPQPIGVPGELHIAGDGLARGYFNRPELTQEKFVANPFTPGTRMYKTGDLARRLEDGTLQYLGRIDTQVKIRGFRIELGEIEARLNQHPAIQESVVTAQGQDAHRRLVAFYRAKETTAESIVQIPFEELRDHLMQTLPEYMVPAAMVSLAAMPLNPNGKVDRRALARMDVTIVSGREYAAPRTDTERQLTGIWAQVLNREPGKIGINDNFFELGGHSLLATQVIAKIRSRMEIDLPLKAIFERSNIAHLSELIEKTEKSDIPAIHPVDRAQLDQLPLSFAQERLWFINQLEPLSAAYNLPVAVTIHEELDLRRLEQAFNLIIARHENLRTIFPSHEGQARQQVLDRVEFKLEHTDLSRCYDQEERDRRTREVCQRDMAMAFDLAHGPLLRGRVITRSEHEHVLLLNMHHIVSDGWSLGVLIQELRVTTEALRRGRDPERKPLPIQYVDYSVWQRKWLEESGALTRHLEYWRQKLAVAPESLDLTTDHPRPSVQSFAGAACGFSLDAALTEQLRGLARQRGVTLYMVLLAAFKVLLYRYTGQNDICVGSPIANRQYAETEGLIGMFVNTLALRSQVEGENTFSALLSQVKATCLEAYEHQDAPFEKVVDAVRPQRNLAISPIFQVMVILQNAATEELDAALTPYPLDSGISKFELTAAFAETSAGLEGSIIYSTALYKTQTIERMTGHFTALCRAIAAAPTAKLRDLDFIGSAEKHRLLTEYNDTRADYPREKCIHQLFAEKVRTNPGGRAVAFEDRELSYRQLYDRSCDLALYLQSIGVRPDSVVGLCVERSLEMMVGIMGTVLAGGAYLPADPAYPDDRLSYMLEDSQATIVLTQEKFKNKIRALSIQKTQLIALDSQWPEISKRAAALREQGHELQNEVKPHHAAYVIYTSGSTGKPKGVLVEHSALVNRLNWMQKTYPLDQGEIVLQKTPYSFDVSVWEFFWPMVTGAALVFAIPDGHKDVNYLEGAINRAGVTTLHFVPSMLHTFLENADAGCGGVKRIFCSGEALDKKSAESFREKFPNASLYNLYGPTEAAIDVTAYDCSRSDYPFVPIGVPIDNTQIYILDPYNRLQPIGVPGELHIAGDGLARGYLNRPKLTQEKFVANPFQPGARMYKTGDLARWLDDGNIQYLGRIDTQVKIRGFRIELGEIEACLNQHAEIHDSAVIAWDHAGNKQLIAFYRAKDTRADNVLQLAYDELRAHLLQTLPEYMVPAAFVSLAAIPLSSNGKVDRRALARIDVRIASGHEYAAPRNDTEKQLAGIWAQVLNLAPEKIGINDNFFELGGHSLLAVKLIVRMKQQGLHAKLQALFTAPTLAELAAAVEDGPNSDSLTAETAPDLDQEAVLDPAIVLRTDGMPGEMNNVLLTGATGFLGAYLLSELLLETRARIHCLVRADSAEAGRRKIEEHLKSYGLWHPAQSGRIVPLPGDLARPRLGLSDFAFEELSRTIDAIYHNGAAINFFYPYRWHKAANVTGTEELLRLAAFGRAKSFHFVSTLSVALTQQQAVISEKDALAIAPDRSGGYVQSKWVAEKLVRAAAARGIPVVTYRPGTITGHSKTGVTNFQDFVPSFIRGCMQAGCVPDVDVHDELHMIPVDYVSRSIVAISKRPELFNRVFNLTLTDPHGITGRELLDHLLRFDPSLQRVPYEKWRSRVVGDRGNALARFIESFPEEMAKNGHQSAPISFDTGETQKILDDAGIERPAINRRLLETYFCYFTEQSVGRTEVSAD